MISKISQWGNSIGVRIPRGLAKDAGIAADSTVEINRADDGIIIKPVGRKEYALRELVKGVTSQNRHHDVDFRRPAGSEMLLDGSDSRSRRCHPLSFDPASGHEQAGFRPAVVLSPELYNRPPASALSVLSLQASKVTLSR